LKALLAAGLVVLCFSGCAGYRIGDVKPHALRNVRTIAVNNFRNATFHPRVETLVTNTIIKQLQQDGTFTLTTADKADAILDGTVVGINRTPARGVSGNVLATAEFALGVTISYAMKAKDGTPLVGPAQMVGGTSFFVGNDVTTDERQALPVAVQDVATRLVSQISEGW
jgi:hypothetical protein